MRARLLPVLLAEMLFMVVVVVVVLDRLEEQPEAHRFMAVMVALVQRARIVRQPGLNLQAAAAARNPAIQALVVMVNV